MELGWSRATGPAASGGLGEAEGQGEVVERGGMLGTKVRSLSAADHSAFELKSPRSVRSVSSELAATVTDHLSTDQKGCKDQKLTKGTLVPSKFASRSQ